MEARPLSFRLSDGRLAWLVGAVLLALGALAYRPLLWSAFERTSGADIDVLLFRPTQLPALLIVSVAAWFLWRRRARLLALPVRHAPIAAAFLLGLGGAIFVWAHLTRASDLFLPSLSAHLLAFAAAVRGRAGCRAVALPALVLALGVQIPGPLQGEIVWRLQLWTTSAAGWLLETLGREVVQGGVILRTGGHSFHVIDGCSGMRGIEILTLVALIVRELFASSGWRLWLLLPLAPVLGFALNVVRIAYVAASPDPEALAGMEGDHTPQGLAVLIAGTAMLYGAGFALAGSGGSRGESSVARPTASLPLAFWGIASSWLAILAVLAGVLSPFATLDRVALPSKDILPEQKSGFVSEDLMGDPLFFGGGRKVVHRRYQPAAGGPRADREAVEVFVGFEGDRNLATSPMLSTKLRWPGPDWDVVRTSPTPLYLLQRDVELTIASRNPGGEHAVVYTWRTGDLGLWRESWHSLLALEVTPFGRQRPRGLVRLIAFSPHDGSLELDRARQRLDRFVRVFRKPLAEF